MRQALSALRCPERLPQRQAGRPDESGVSTGKGRVMSESAPVYDAATVSRLLNFSYSREQLVAFGRPPKSLDGFVTFFDPGFSIAALWASFATRKSLLMPIDCSDAQVFAHVTDHPRYRQVRAAAVPRSVNKDLATQLRLLSLGEESAPARVVVTGIVVHFLATSKRLFRGQIVRCADKTDDDGHVIVGFDGSRLCVQESWDAFRSPDIGLASCRNC